MYLFTDKKLETQQSFSNIAVQIICIRNTLIYKIQYKDK